MTFVKDFYDGMRFFGQLLVNSCTKGVTSLSKKYLTIVFQDSSGTIEAKRWDPVDGEEEIYVPGNIVQVEGEVLLYKDKLQMKVLSGEKASISHIDFSRFVPSAPVEKQKLIEKLEWYLASFKDEEVKKLTTYIIRKHYEKYVEWPAAVRNHHNYVSGILYHSLTMADHAEKACEIYPSLNRDVLVAGCLLHDLGKTIELSGPVATTFTIEGKLLGHISIMQAEVRNSAKELGMEDSEIALCLEHMILSHHGKPEYGSAIMPLTREALALSMIDDFDAKMTILDKAYADVEPGGTTSKIFTLDERYFYLPKYTAKKDQKD